MNNAIINWPIERANILSQYDHLWQDAKLVYPMQPSGKMIYNRGPSGRRYDLTITGDSVPAVWKSSDNGAVVELNGTTGYISGTKYGGLSSYSFGLWYIPLSTSGRHPIVDQENIYIYQQDDDIYWGFVNDVYIDIVNTESAVLAIDTPVHIFVSKLGSVCSLFINGRLVDTLTNANTPLDILTGLTLGRDLRESFVFPSLTPANLTAEKGILINASDDLQQTTGSVSLNSNAVAENINSNQMTILLWMRTNFSPGDGNVYYVFNTIGTNSTTNLINVRIATNGALFFDIYDKDSTLHRFWSSITGWSAGEWHQIAIRFDFKNDEGELYVDGASVDSVPNNAFVSDSMDAIEANTHIGSDVNGANQLNGAMTYLAESRSWTDAEITTNYNAGAGTPFVISPYTLALGDFTQSGTGIVYHPGQMAISSISTVTLTLSVAADTKLIVGEKVVVYDDANPANYVYTGVATVSGTTVTVDDSCAAVTGTNKTITRNLLVDGDMEIAGIGSWTTVGTPTASDKETDTNSDTLSLHWVADAIGEGYSQAITALNGDKFLLNLSERVTAGSFKINITNGGGDLEIGINDAAWVDKEYIVSATGNLTMQFLSEAIGDDINIGRAKLIPCVAGDSLVAGLYYTLVYNVDTATIGSAWSGLGSEATEVAAGDLYIRNDTAPSTIAARTMDYANARFNTPILYNKALPATFMKSLYYDQLNMLKIKNEYFWYQIFVAHTLGVADTLSILDSSLFGNAFISNFADSIALLDVMDFAEEMVALFSDNATILDAIGQAFGFIISDSINMQEQFAAIIPALLQRLFIDSSTYRIDILRVD